MKFPLKKTRRGIALIAVLIVVVVLSLAAYRFSDSMTAEERSSIRLADAMKAKSYAISGIHYAMGSLSDPNTFNNQLGGNPFDNSAWFASVPLAGADGSTSGYFTVVAPADTFIGTGQSRYVTRYGVTDESAKLNINTLMALDPTGNTLYKALMQLPNMTPSIADSIVDWVDSDDTPRANGSESAYYQGLASPYNAKNGPINSLDELLLVNGVTPQLLYGNDRNNNGVLDSGEDDGTDFNRGWRDFLTPYGRELDVDTNGNPRLSLNSSSTSPSTLSQSLTTALNQQQSDFILAVRLYGSSPMSPAASGSSSTGTATTTSSTTSSSTAKSGTTSSSSSTTSSPTPSQNSSPQTIVGTAAQLRAAVQQSLTSGASFKNKISSLSSLFNVQVTLPQPPNAPRNAPTIIVQSPWSGATLKTMLPALVDKVTTHTKFEISPRVNVNNAPPEVLAALPGLTSDDVTNIVNARQSQSLSTTDPALTTGTWIFTQAGVNVSKFSGLENYITGKTMTYRVQTIGYAAGGTGPVARMEAVIDTNQGSPRIVYFRDLTDLGRGFDPPQ